MTLTRRRFLRAAGVSLALPWLDAFAVAREAAGEWLDMYGNRWIRTPEGRIERLQE